MKNVYIKLDEAENGLVLLARFLEDYRTINRLQHLQICNDLFSYCTRAVAHPHAFAAFLPRVVTAAEAFSGFTDKQKGQLRTPTYSSRRADDDGPEWIPYDGPDDLDRYNGGGDWDIEDGYYLS